MPFNIRSFFSSWWKIALAIIALIALILALIGLLFLRSAKNDPLSSINTSAPKFEVSTKDNFWIGSANPKVTIIEFADFGCSFCKKEFPIIRALSVKYKNDVRVIFKDYPVVTEHSALLAHSARCAGEQGLFWPMHDKLFLNQGADTEEGMAELAKQVGADEARYKTCMETDKFFPRIQADFEEGEKLGLTGTPTWFINGYRVAGDVPLKTFEEIIGYFLENNSE
jgi:protein-disulfide isomerase